MLRAMLVLGALRPTNDCIPLKGHYLTPRHMIQEAQMKYVDVIH